MGATQEKSTLTKARINFGYLIRYMGHVVHYGFVPFIIYMGIKTGQTDPNMPEITLRSLVWQ